MSPALHFQEYCVLDPFSVPSVGVEISVMLSVLAQVAGFLHPLTFVFLTWCSAWYSGGQRQLQSHFLTCSLPLCSSDAKVLIVSSQTFLCRCCFAFFCFLYLRPFVFTWLNFCIFKRSIQTF